MAETAGNEFLYRQVERQVRDLIDTGVLRPGERAPSLRRMSRQADVSIATVMQAYLELERKGLVEARPKSGFFVRARPRPKPAPPRTAMPRPTPRRVKLEDVVGSIFEAAHSPEMVYFGIANPSLDLLPVKTLARTTARVAARSGAEALGYCPPPGLPALRRQIAYWYAELGCVVDPDEIVVTNGATGALSLSLQAVARPGDAIAVESPCYFLLLQLIERLGMLAVEVKTDPVSGMSADALEAVLDQVDVRAAIIVSNFSNPTGAVVPDEQKRALATLAAERGVALIEDDIYGDLAFGSTRPSPVKRFDEDATVLSCASFSKTLAPGYRVGWVTAGRRRTEILQLKQSVASDTATLPQLVLAEFLAHGGYERFLRGIRAAYQDRVERMRDAVYEHFPEGTRISDPQGGFVIWIELPRGIDADALFPAALEAGVSYTPGSLFSPTRKYRNFMRLSCALAWTERVETALRRLGRLVCEARPAG